MLFNSFQYWIFFLIVAVLFYSMPFRIGKVLLVLASYVFYMWWDPRFIVLILTDDEQPKGSSQTNTGPDGQFPWLLGFEAHRKQLLNYLRGSKIEVGLLLHFGRKARFYRLLYTNDRKPHPDGPT